MHILARSGWTGFRDPLTGSPRGQRRLSRSDRHIRTQGSESKAKGER